VALARDREWVVGLFETCVGLGFAVGPLLGGLLGHLSWRVPFFVCGALMLVALVVSATRLKDPAERPATLRLGQVFGLFRKPGFLALAAVTAAYNFVFFVVLGYVPVFLGLDVVPLGLVFTAWGIGVAVGILGVGHRLAHAIGFVQTLGVAVAGVLLCVLLLAVGVGTAGSIAVTIGAGVFMGIANANLTDLSLALGDPDRRVTTGAFNLVRWGFAAPAPVVAGLLSETVGLSSPFWVASGVLLAGVLVFLVTAHVMARPLGERVLWRRWNRGARQEEGTPEEALSEI